MPKKGNILQPVRIIDLSRGGDVRGIHEADGQAPLPVYFDARTVVPGDVVNARILGKRNGLWQGRLEEILTPSPQRQTARCAHFGTCGGCGLQHWPYALQLQQKEQLVRSILAPFLERAEWLPALGSEEQWFFRNKMEFTVAARSWQAQPATAAAIDVVPPAFGLFVPFSGNKVLDINNCLLQAPLGDAVRDWLRSYAFDHDLPAYHSSRHDGWLRTLLIRTASTGQSLVMFIVASEFPAGGPADALQQLVSDFKQAFPQVTSVWTLVNSKLNDSYADLQPVHASGVPEIEEVINGLRFLIGPQTFFQVNSRQTQMLYQRITELSDLNSEGTVYDLYCGVGSISACLAPFAKRVVGIEYVESSIAAARLNANRNKLDNLHFIAGDMKDLLVPSLFSAQETPDVVVTDPPRAGMHPRACETLAASGTRRIVYVSCNPESLARDLAILVPRYRLTAVQVVDLMPQSHHVETIAVLEKA